MFAIYRRNVGGRIVDRYFRNYESARQEIKQDVQRMRVILGAVVTETIDRMNVAKGFWEYEVRMALPDGETASLAIVDGYFEDE